MTISVFDLMRIGVGPSSSHTVGPMIAGLNFGRLLHGKLQSMRGECHPQDHAVTDLPKIAGAVTRSTGITIILYGSLAATGVGHGTLAACLAGLDGFDPATLDPDEMQARIEVIRATRSVNLAGDAGCPVPCGFEDIILRPFVIRTIHTNAVTFSAVLPDGEEFKETYYSIGGGFIRTNDEVDTSIGLHGPWLFSSGRQLVELAEKHAVSIAEVQRRCEKSLLDDDAIDQRLDALAAAMEACARRGIRSSGVLPGGLQVKKRAGDFYRSLLKDDPGITAEYANDWVDLVALSVNEENAAGGRVVTAPTNGAAGIVPAVGFYALTFTPAGKHDPVAARRRYLLACGAIGSLYKERASISGAEVGCQGEVGSAASMAAAGLAEVMGGSPRQVANAAEIAMEHSLGLTCDPVGGLVQVPCIERNAISACKAINAARMALRGDGTHRVSLDEVIETMRQTGKDMSDRYKETSGGGLATTVAPVAVNVPEC
ncbi:L-serine ammonia-lyase [Corynebacterium mendelii]|uniref:L-serine dehydratase n=1 Tax=Corynebacterium mendelii TaxID=2765362 RepID=A0A939DYB4_9CORY|nr:L-serine ammonia-lyase [Corynebacterium mendelii]MBN9643049.1 L-serine ammonia-lyase [Corynebacterium mendelii]